MTEETEALRLADALSAAIKQVDADDDVIHVARWFVEDAAAELRRLHAENFALAAGQCMNVVGDEGGTPMCFKAQQLQAARERDNVSFKQLLAQRDALLEALQALYDEQQGPPLIRHQAAWEAAMEKARAAIKAVEEEA